MKPRFRTSVIAGLLVAAGLTGASSLAFADAGSRTSGADDAATAAGSTPPPLVEDFQHPNAEKILQERGITLKKGDGRIFFAECDNSPTQISVWTRQSGDGKVCFQSTATTGYLSLEIPEVYALQTESRAVHAELSAEGKVQEVDLVKNDFKGVGEGVGSAPTVLLELRVTG